MVACGNLSYSRLCEALDPQRGNDTMTVWDTYPSDYRSTEVGLILRTVQAGECVSLVGLSGAGKSNLLGFLANRPPQGGPHFVLVDCNRLAGLAPEAFFHLIRRALGDVQAASDELAALESALGHHLAGNGALCLLLDRFDAGRTNHAGNNDPDGVPSAVTLATPAIAMNLRALRDAYKYDLTYVIATRRPLDPHSELAELFYAHTLWLGPLSESDAHWNVARYASRKNLAWDEATTAAILDASRGYPSFLRAACEAVADGAPLDVASLCGHAALQRRLEEFWADQPSDDEIRLSGLARHPLLGEWPLPAACTNVRLTAKERVLLEYFQQHEGQVCEKDDLIRAVWPEDKIFARGVRDDSLAQLIRRLREKVEPDPAMPRHIHTVSGRGYRYTG